MICVGNETGERDDRLIHRLVTHDIPERPVAGNLVAEGAVGVRQVEAKPVIFLIEADSARIRRRRRFLERNPADRAERTGPALIVDTGDPPIEGPFAQPLDRKGLPGNSVDIEFKHLEIG